MPNTITSLTFFGVVRAAIFLAWLFSPPFLLFLALRIGRRTRQSDSNSRNRRLFSVIVPVVLADWVLFVVLLMKAQMPYGGLFDSSHLTDVLLLISCCTLLVSFAAYAARWPLALANASLIALWIISAYAPAHWMRRVDWGVVKVDDLPVAASIFIGNPTDMEAEAVVFVHLANGEDYFLSFGEEKVRLAAEHEYLCLPGGMWSFRSMRKMMFTEPLPFRRTNEFRIASPKGEVISILF
ncbi:MAG TPA: hypothetical protein VKZ53_23275 [Candidatus Angelobacter sp.]|nr:hypothetical protein [Candidatus Angelobacter sp.]